MNTLNTILFIAGFLLPANIIISHYLKRRNKLVKATMSTWGRNLVVHQAEREEVSTSLGESDDAFAGVILLPQ